MRKTTFGETIVDSVNDDLGVMFYDHDLADYYAVITKEDAGSHSFEIMNIENGNILAESDAIFKTQNAAREYLRGWLKNTDIQKRLGNCHE